MLIAHHYPVSQVALIPSDPCTDEANYDSTRWIGAALEQLGLEVISLDRSNPAQMVNTLLQGHPYAVRWNTGLNHFGEDGTIAGLLRTLFPEQPYVGSGVLGGALALDKEHCQDAFRALGYPGPQGFCFHPNGDGSYRASKPEGERSLAPMFRPWLVQQWLRTPKLAGAHPRPHIPRPDYTALCARLGPRLVLKPLSSGASLGLHLADDAASFQEALDAIASRYGSVLVEEELQGAEYAVCVLETCEQLLPVCHINTQGLHDTADKLAPNYRIPAPISATLADELRRVARLAHDYLGCHGFSRLDCIVDRKGRIRPLEVNSNPGLIPGQSVFPAVCAAAGLNYPAMIEKILETAFLPRRREITRRASSAEVPPFPEELRSFLPALSEQEQRPRGRQTPAAPSVSIAAYHC